MSADIKVLSKEASLRMAAKLRSGDLQKTPADMLPIFIEQVSEIVGLTDTVKDMLVTVESVVGNTELLRSSIDQLIDIADNIVDLGGDLATSLKSHIPDTIAKSVVARVDSAISKRDEQAREDVAVAINAAVKIAVDASNREAAAQIRQISSQLEEVRAQLAKERERGLRLQEENKQLKAETRSTMGFLWKRIRTNFNL